MLRFILGILFGIIAVVFVFQNTEVVDVTMLFWTVTLSRSIMYIVLFGLGLFVGWFVSGLKRIRTRGK